MHMHLTANVIPSLCLAQLTIVPPALISILCVLAGVGTFLLMPSRRGAGPRRIGATLALLALAIFGVLLFRYAAGQASQGQPALSPYFWIFAAITIIGALRVVTHPHPVYCALYFVLTVFSTAGLFVLLAAEFMAAALVMIYAGAILVTYVFVIMLAQQTQQSITDASHPLSGLPEYDRVAREPIAATLIGFILMGLLLFVIFDLAPQQPAGEPTTAVATVRQLGERLFSQDLMSVEVAGIILTLAMVGAIAIARRRIPADESTPVEARPDLMELIDDDPHAIPVYGTKNPGQKSYPET